LLKFLPMAVSPPGRTRLIGFIWAYSVARA